MSKQVSLADAVRDRLPIHPSQNLETMPGRMIELLLTERNGFWWVTPWFVAVKDGAVDFRVADGSKWRDAVLNQRCWVCGGRLGVHLTFVLGPMCTVTRTTAEPPCHVDCAVWSVANCPFMANPEMVRRPAPMPEGAKDAPGLGLARNPGVTALWPTRDFKTFKDHEGRYLIRVGDPSGVVHWYAQGRKATRQEILASIHSGLPALTALAEDQGPEAVSALFVQVNAAQQYLPAA
jgi:hypothetical protein